MPAIVAWRGWFAGGEAYRSEDVDWSDLPDDGALSFRLIYDKINESNGLPYVRIMDGSEWYFRWAAPDGSVVYGQSTNFLIPGGVMASESREMIEQRYPGAEIIKGKWTCDEMMDRVKAEAFKRIDDPKPCEAC